MGVKRFVLQGCRKSLSALHAELEGFIWIWAMSCLREVYALSDYLSLLGYFPTNLPEDGEKKGAHIAPSANSTPPAHPQCPTCQIDASWIDNGTVSGLGWFYNDQMGVKRFVLQGCRKSLSALHAELEGFIWAMSCLREVVCTTIHMETDCSDLVA
ncbi:hypothetical protein DY000_02008374 [Brassica cretica]|uniref:RNase H type-1 domain-containing protein n=1 Tax=Brassica cretica TaxID=69181 RepID=A0ABQ7C8H3_BRACR|nr:hypothetical protein DY000_02008374 [Brassica cretica]